MLNFKDISKEKFKEITKNLILEIQEHKGNGFPTFKDLADKFNLTYDQLIIFGKINDCIEIITDVELSHYNMAVHNKLIPDNLKKLKLVDDNEIKIVEDDELKLLMNYEIDHLYDN